MAIAIANIAGRSDVMEPVMGSFYS